ncbi:MAG: PBP1A family penicillin-binding protein [Clostridia bacterium]|nr:PBP1A family penicillin-binding protein [Clostridia bacterium]
MSDEQEMLPDTPDKDSSEETPPEKKKGRWRRWILWSLLGLLIVGGVAFYFIFDVANWQTLDVNKLTQLAQTGSIYDKDGNYITALKGSEHRILVTLEEIPLYVQQAFLAAEDLRFYKHPGFDIVRIFGAVMANLRSGSYAQGASTITQQLVKLSHLSSQKTIARKLEEIYLAVQMERQFTKDQILEMYLNYIYFGNGAYGLQTASQAYFSKDVQELTLAQAASLAATIKAPSAYAPHTSPENNKERRGYILSTMLAEGMITQEAYDEAIAEEITVAATPVADRHYGWFLDAVMDEAELQLGISSELLLAGGYRIDTTLDTGLQEIADAQYAKDLFPENASDGTPVQSGMACVDVNSGAVRAVVGGREYTVQRGLNRATQLRRQPGSALKPLVAYAPAIESFGYTPASVLKDEPTDFGGYKPRNSGYTYYGMVTFRSALRSSLNVPAVALLQQIGVSAGRNYLASVGLPLDDRDSNLSLALGSMTYGVSPVQLAAAYSPFANGGLFYEPYFITRITDASGAVVYEHQPQGRRVLSAQTAYLMTNLLQSVTSSGTGAKLSASGVPVAGKTGTVNMTGGGNRDIWMAAYNPEISVAAWMGFDQPDSTHKLASWVSGGDYTAALCRDFFKAAYTGKSKPSFARPGGIISLEIDKKAIEWRGEAMLATNLTPKAYRYTEVFSENNKPTKYSDVWNAPRTPNSFYVTHTSAGKPQLVIQPADNAIYRIQRDAVGESFILTEMWGSAGETLYYTDEKAIPGVVYTYRVIPVHGELLENGILLEGVQSVQVAQARAPQSSGFLDRVVDFLFGPASTDERRNEEAENVSSIFWN